MNDNEIILNGITYIRKDEINSKTLDYNCFSIKRLDGSEDVNIFYNNHLIAWIKKETGEFRALSGLLKNGEWDKLDLDRVVEKC